MELRVSELNASDQIMIRTQFNDYSFRVIDPLTCRGFLSGGPLGDQPEEAFFAGAISGACSQPRDAARLETGYCAVFFVDGKYLKKLTTSIITEITLSVAQPEVC